MSSPLVSINILEGGIRLLKIPRKSVNEHMHSIVRMLLFRSHDDPFFSLTLNDIELSIYATSSELERVFGPILDSQMEATAIDRVEMSDEIWVALQVEQHGDQDLLEESGNRINELAQPLAAEGISILYCSTYISDFILLKRHRLEQVISILQKQSGFTFQHAPEEGLDGLSDASSISSEDRVRAWSKGHQAYGQDSREPSPLNTTLNRSIAGSLYLKDSSPGGSKSRNSSPAASRASRSRQSSLSRSHFLSALTLTSPKFIDEQSLPLVDDAEQIDYAAGDPLDELPESAPRSFEDPLKTMVPPTAESSPIPALNLADKLCVLPDELVCVGLNRESETSWREKLVQAFFYSDDVLPPQPDAEFDDAATDDIPGYSPSLIDSELAHSGELNGLSSSIYSNRNVSSHPSTSRRRKPKTFADSMRDEALPSPNGLSSASFLHHSPSTSMADHPTPFVSFTATQEGCSLTADIRLLRKLFPNDNGNAIFAAGEGGLDSPWIGEDGDEGQISSEPEDMDVTSANGRGRRRNRSLQIETNVARQDSHHDLDGSRRLLKCLQVDLSSFGLDKTGIVNMLTDILTSNNINLLYSSTFATANILVSKNDLSKARSTLVDKL